MATSTTGAQTNMDMSSIVTATLSMTMATATGSMDSMSMSNIIGSAGRVCQIQMLWNWNTIGACFITPQWQIASRGGMIGTCFGVVFLVVVLEMLRRAAKEFDRWVIRTHKKKHASAVTSASRSARNRQGSLPPAPDDARRMDSSVSRKSSSTVAGFYEGGAAVGAEKQPGQFVTLNNCRAPTCRPNVWQQAFRALLHAGQFTMAYIIMLLAMNYNGYILISIVVGAYLGSFFFSWEPLSQETGSTSVGEEATVCCS